MYNLSNFFCHLTRIFFGFLNKNIPLHAAFYLLQSGFIGCLRSVSAMDDNFFRYLFEKQETNTALPPNEIIWQWALKVIHLLYPENSKNEFLTTNDLTAHAKELHQELSAMLSSSCDKRVNCCSFADRFFDQLPELYRILNTDITAIFDGDPAASSKLEIIRTYPGFYAICFYRIAHVLHQFGIPLIPRILTEHAHSRTGIDIHPGAIIGEYFYIDHGTGIVIGETSVIGRYVKLYQGVTLGALSVRKTLLGIKRHPTVEDSVVIYAGATILGGETQIGHDSIIGGNVWITESLQPFSTVYHSPTITIRNVNENLNG